VEEDFIGHLESAIDTGLVVAEVEQAVIGDDNKGIHLVNQIRDPIFSDLATVDALKGEGFGDDGNGERPALSGKFSRYWYPPGAGTAAQTGGKENHIRPGDNIFHFIAALLGSPLTHYMVATGTQASGEPLTKLDAYAGFSYRQVLGIGIHGNKFHTPDLLPNHSSDCITACPAQTDNLNLSRAGNITCLCHLFLLLNYGAI
jgi:hypothetical protein